MFLMIILLRGMFLETVFPEYNFSYRFIGDKHFEMWLRIFGIYSTTERC